VFPAKSYNEGTTEEYSWLVAFNLRNITQLVAKFYSYYPKKLSLSTLTTTDLCCLPDVD